MKQKAEKTKRTGNSKGETAPPKVRSEDEMNLLRQKAEKTKRDEPSTQEPAPPKVRSEDEMNLLRQKALASMRNRRTVQLMKSTDEEDVKKPSPEMKLDNAEASVDSEEVP